jgi:hypothetical protein
MSAGIQIAVLIILSVGFVVFVGCLLFSLPFLRMPGNAKMAMV